MPLILLKGAAYVMAGLRAAALRFTRDLGTDISAPVHRASRDDGPPALVWAVMDALVR